MPCRTGSRRTPRQGGSESGPHSKTVWAVPGRRAAREVPARRDRRQRCPHMLPVRPKGGHFSGLADRADPGGGRYMIEWEPGNDGGVVIASALRHVLFLLKRRVVITRFSRGAGAARRTGLCASGTPRSGANTQPADIIAVVARDTASGSLLSAATPREEAAGSLRTASARHAQPVDSRVRQRASGAMEWQPRFSVTLLLPPRSRSAC